MINYSIESFKKMKLFTSNLNSTANRSADLLQVPASVSGRHKADVWIYAE